jgi:uncharacterized protein
MEDRERIEKELEQERELAEIEKRRELGTLTVRDAGRLGGLTTAKRHGPQFYEEIGRKGGQKVKRLIEAGKALRDAHGGESRR